MTTKTLGRETRVVTCMLAYAVLFLFVLAAYMSLGHYFSFMFWQTKNRKKARKGWGQGWQVWRHLAGSFGLAD